VEKVNEFVDMGNGLDLLISLYDDLYTNEFKKLNKILLDPACKYNNFATFIELGFNNSIILVNKLKKKLVSVYNIASNVSIVGLTKSYPDINPLTLYTNCAIQMVSTYTAWSIFINNSIIFNRFTERKLNNFQMLDKNPIAVLVPEPDNSQLLATSSVVGAFEPG
jgi:hypothetical protein